MILTAGRLSKSTKISGFTLVELIIVIIIFSILLSLSFPMIRKFSLFSEDGSQAVNIAHLVDDLKIRAINDRRDFILHLDTSAGRIWVTHEEMDQDQIEEAIQKGVQLAEGTQINEVQFAGASDDEPQEYQIRFRRKGYSDFAYIRMVEKGHNLTLAIEPFLPQTRILNRHVHFENCN